jgi:hypothetical protein
VLGFVLKMFVIAVPVVVVVLLLLVLVSWTPGGLNPLGTLQRR